ncbi:Phage regulatory protein Rha (Phage_pRha) [Pseudomonas helmanticensis]|uniref:Phage regulatory protein Rha (Phage_pRha) n=1 Tax=Pseudomonas helmanticensis TaxID=1471381 RepID=A0ACD2U7J3_9PSED|nr:Rha family transcriptional regulator [Pseudomonas helmanticensis]SMQ26932.1 Phage regulatory protein Rha (Phage_pRha) [Pseudomonas helmanticensis]
MHLTNITNPNTPISVFEKIANAGSVAPSTLNGLPGMSSLEIAQATGKSHKHVLRDITKMIKEIGPLLGQCQYIKTLAPDGYGRLQPIIILDKELTFTVLTGYNATLRLLVNRRWLELEGSGFKRVSIQDAVVHLVEREKVNRQAALRVVNRGKPSPQLTAQEKELQRLYRAAQRYEKMNPMR